MIKVYRYRVKSLNGLLNAQARAVNFVWNYCNETQRHAHKWGRKWLSGFDLNYLAAGSSKELGLSSGTVYQTCQRYARSRQQSNKPYLQWRSKRSLGWIPVRGESLKRSGNAFRFYSNTFRVFDSRPLPEGKIKDGSNFSQDARGNWFLNVVMEIADAQPRDLNSGVGIDLGLKDFAALSTGEVIANPRHFRKLEEALGRAQRARKKRQALNVHARIKNARADHLHKLSTRIVREFDYIAVGNVNAAGLAKTSMAKSVNDVGWSTFRNMLHYKAIAHGATFEEVSERFTSQVCSACGCMPPERPKGIADLGIREWTCSECETIHHRDVNAARNILRLRHQAPAEGIGA